MTRCLAGLLTAVLSLSACGGSSTEHRAVSSSTSVSTSGSTTTEPAREPVRSGWLVYGTRDGDGVTVFRRRLGPGDPEVLFHYDEEPLEQPPHLAVSDDGRLVAYTVAGMDLRVWNLETGRDDLLVSGQVRPPPPNADAYPPRWSVDGMNYLSAEEQAECHHCGILAIGTPYFSPSGRWMAFEQRYYEGANWGFIELATGRYETSGDAAGDVFWKRDQEIVTIGTFYGEEAQLRTATLDELPDSRLVPVGGAAMRRELRGALHPAGDQVVVIFEEPSDVPTCRRVGVMPLEGGDLTPLDTEGEKLAAGFSGDGTAVWIERQGDSGVLVRSGAAPVPLPADLWSFSAISTLGPDEIGVAAGRRPADNAGGPCVGRYPPFERYLVVNVRDGAVVWTSPTFDSPTTFAGTPAR